MANSLHREIWRSIDERGKVEACEVGSICDGWDRFFLYNWSWGSTAQYTTTWNLVVLHGMEGSEKSLIWAVFLIFPE